MRVDGKFLAVNDKSVFDCTFTAVTQHDGKFLAVDGFPFFDGNFLAVDGKSSLYRDRPPVRYFYVGKITEHLPDDFLLGEVSLLFSLRVYPRLLMIYLQQQGHGRRWYPVYRKLRQYQ